MQEFLNISRFGKNNIGNLERRNGRYHLNSYRLKSFEMEIYYPNEPRFKGIYSRNNLLKKKVGACVINLDEYESIEAH